MRNNVDIDSTHSRAIVRAIGNRLREASEDTHCVVLPTSLQMQLDRLREADNKLSQPIAG